MRTASQLRDQAGRVITSYLRWLERRPLVDPGDSGAGGAGSVTPVRVRKDGGTAGDASSPASWTYGIWPLGVKPSTDPTNGSRIAATRQPHNRNNFPGRVAFAVEDSYGLALFDPLQTDENLQWVLLIAFNERPETAVCVT